MDNKDISATSTLDGNFAFFHFTELDVGSFWSLTVGSGLFVLEFPATLESTVATLLKGAGAYGEAILPCLQARVKLLEISEIRAL